jgi:1-acyl-sn-glycerol-3-phosphate acyltransferase
MIKPAPILSVFMWVTFTTVYVVIFLVGLVVSIPLLPFDKHRKTMNWFFMLGGMLLPKYHPFLKMTIEGLEHVDLKQPRIFVANHQSFMDMTVLAGLPWNMKWLSKDGMFKIPGVGTMMTLGGHVGIKRGTTGAALALDRLKPYIKDAVPVMIFPEGTRSVTGQMTAFKNGAFLLSRDTQAAIQPIVIHGTHQMLPPGTWKFRSKGAIRVSVLKAVHPNEFETLDAFRETVFLQMKSEFDHLASINELK